MTTDLDFKLYKPHRAEFDAKPNPKLCAQSVMSKGSWHAHQCQRGVVVNELGHGWCRQHAPSFEKAKQAEKEARWKSENQARDYSAKVKLAEAAVVAVAESCCDRGLTLPDELLSTIHGLKHARKGNAKT